MPCRPAHQLFCRNEVVGTDSRIGQEQDNNHGGADHLATARQKEDHGSQGAGPDAPDHFQGEQTIFGGLPGLDPEALDHQFGGLFAFPFFSQEPLRAHPVHGLGDGATIVGHARGRVNI